jgi:molybdopterin-containing oxidoreductase family membrane subunit
MIILFQLIRKYTRIEIKNEAIFKVAELIAYSMFINLFLLGAEVFKEYYSNTVHLAPLQYLLQGLKGHNDLVPYIWTAMIFNVSAFFLFLVPQTRENYVTLNVGCVLIFIGVYIEKGMGLVIPGQVPDTLGEIYEYAPTGIELLVTLGIWATGLLVYTLLLRVAVPILTGEFFVGEDGRTAVIVDTEFIRRADHLAEQSYRD